MTLCFPCHLPCLRPPGELERYTVPIASRRHIGATLRADAAQARPFHLCVIRMATPWWRLDAQLKHRDGKRTLVGLRISRDKQARHLELVVCLETPHENTRAPSSAETERVPLSMVDIRDEQHGVLHLSAHYPSMSVQIRPHHVLGGESALAEFARFARLGKARDDDPSLKEAPSSEAVIREFQESFAAGRVAQQPRDIRPRTLASMGLGGFKARSTLPGGPRQLPAGATTVTGSPTIASAGRSSASFGTGISSSLWGASKAASSGSAGARQYHSASVTSGAAGHPNVISSSASAQRVPSSSPRPSSSFEQAAAASARSAAQQASIRDRALGIAPASGSGSTGAGGPTFGYEEDEGRGGGGRGGSLRMPHPGGGARRSGGAGGPSAMPPTRLGLASSLASAQSFQTSHYHSSLSSSSALDPRANTALGHVLGHAGDGGFKNIGNTCYMNAVLSSFLGLNSFVADVLALLPAFQPKLGGKSVYSALQVRQRPRALCALPSRSPLASRFAPSLPTAAAPSAS